MSNALVIAFLLTAAPWRTYEVYEPTVERCFVVDPAVQELKYNHVSSIAWFKDRWFCVWNGNAIPDEGKPGQLNYMSTSFDAVHWTPPEPAFASEARSQNPIPCPKGCQWQPNLLVTSGELWAFWDHHSKDDYRGCYLSRLEDPDGKWQNRRLLWDGAVSADSGDRRATLDGKPFRPFPTQNAFALRSGRILQPVTLMGSKASDAPDDLDNWWVNEKRSSVLYSDDGGATWRVSPGAILPGRSWAQWEPTVWEEPDGSLMMLARNNDPRAPSRGGPTTTQCLLWSRSEDGGATWTPHEPVAIETVVSRPHVLPAGGDRYLMVHSDWHSGRFCSDRLNLALFSTRGSGFDFAAGPGISGNELIVAYPQMCFHDDALYVSYTQGLTRRGIKVARIAPLPHPERYYLFPRTNRLPPGAPVQEGNVFRFDGREYVATDEALDPGENAFSLSATICPSEQAVLLDSRGPEGGIVWALTRNEERDALAPFVHMNTPEGNIKSRLVVPFDEWVYCGVSVDREAGTVLFAVNGETGTVPFTPTERPFRGATGHIGYKRIENSALTGFVGKLGALALYRDVSMTAEEHEALAAAVEKGGMTPQEMRGNAPTLRLDGAEPLEDQPFAAVASAASVRLLASEEGNATLEIVGDASAGVDLDANDRAAGDVVHFTFRARVDQGQHAVLCTVGDGNRPVRISVYEGTALLESIDMTIALAPADGWFSVHVRSGKGITAAQVNDATERELPHQPQATWLYLGDGYPSGDAGAPRRVLIDVASVRSRIER